MIRSLGYGLIFSTTTQLIPTGVVTTINFERELFDDSDCHNDKANPSRVTITDNYNVVRFNSRITLSFQANTNYIATIRKNGGTITPYGIINNINLSSDGLSACIGQISSFWIPCLKNDFFELAITQVGLADINCLSAWLEIELGIY